MLLSRVADALYWISRYLERAEHTARLIDVRLDLGLDRPPRRRRAWHFDGCMPRSAVAAGRVADSSGVARRRADVRSANPRVGPVVRHLARENARQVREEISSDMWEQINALFLRISRRSASARRWRARITCRVRSSKACISSRA
jgi:uncharacterized alpha-E superfamily protein